MKGKNVFFALGLSLAMGLGAVAALASHREVKQAKATGETYYFQNTHNWEHLYIHYWGGTDGTSWPGVELTDNAGSSSGHTMYAYDGFGDNTDYLLHNNAGTQTVDLSFASFGSNNAFWISSDKQDGKYKEGGYWTFTPQSDPSAETNTFYVYDGDKVLGDAEAFANVKVYGFGQDENTKAMEWPGTHAGVATDTLGELGVYKVELSTSYPNFIMTGNSHQTVNVEDFTTHHDDLLVIGSANGEGKYQYSWMETSEFTDYPGEVGYYISGLSDDWTYSGAVKMNNTDQDGNVALKLNVAVAANEEFRVRSYYKNRFPYNVWATPGQDELMENTTKLGEKDGDNFKILVAGNYDIYAKYEADVLKFYVAKAAVTYDVTVYAELYRGKDHVQEIEVGTYVAYSNSEFEYTPASRDNYGIRGIFTDQDCTLAYTPAILDADTDLYVRYNLLGYYVFGDAGAGVTWNIDGGSYLTTDVQDTANNLLEGTITITGASKMAPVEVRPGQYNGSNEISWSLTYTMGATYEFAKKVGDNMQFYEDGTYAIYVNKSAQVYLNAGADAFYTKFLTEVSTICDADGDTNVTNLKSVWSAQEVAYNSLSTDEKNAIKALGFDDVGEEDDMHKVVTKYHYIVVKYFSQGINDFIWNAYSPSNVVKPLSANNNALVIIVVVSTVTMASLVGLYLIIRRRKEVK